jgi:hypothetical protein
MPNLTDRERGFEAHFALDEEQEFKAQARRDRMLGHWAGERMGLSGAQLVEYSASVLRADLKEPGDEDVFRKIAADFADSGVECSASELRTKMDQFLATARNEIKEGR